jgi:DHA2 family multidrug resistance protein-like MFS transporter
MQARHDTTVSARKATRREWIGLGVIALPCFLYSADLTVLYLAIPSITTDLRPSSTELLWIMDIYGFLVAGFLITMGTLGDRIGRRKLLLIGAAAFGVASVLAAFATSAGMLIFARALLGVAGATLGPSTLSLIRNMFLDDRERTFAIGVWVAAFSAGGAIAPLLGGVMLAWFWWGSVFLLAVPVMILLLAVGPFLLPEYRDPNAGRLDLLSAVLSLVAVLGVIYGVKQIAAHGFGLGPALSILAGLAIGALFALRQVSLADPLVDLRLFRIPAFSASLTALILGIFGAFGAFMFFAQYLQLVLGMSSLEAGLWTAPTGLVMLLGSMFAPALLSRFRPAHVMTGGFALAAAGLVLLTQVGENGLAVMMVSILTICLGLAPIGTLATDLVVSSAPPERAGAASALSEMSAELGGALGIAVLGSVATAIYRSEMAAAVPNAVPPAAADAARDTLGGAVDAAHTLPDALAAQLLSLARAAFVDGLEVAAVIGAVLAVLTAVITATLLRNARRGGSPAPAHDQAVSDR